MTPPTFSFGDKISGLREAGAMKLFGPNKKRSVTSEKGGAEIETPKPVSDTGGQEPKL